MEICRLTLCQETPWRQSSHPHPPTELRQVCLQVEMTWNDVRQWLSKVAIVAAGVVEDGRENTEEIIKMVGEIKMIVKMTSRRYTV